VTASAAGLNENRRGGEAPSSLAVPNFNVNRGAAKYTPSPSLSSAIHVGGKRFLHNPPERNCPNSAVEKLFLLGNVGPADSVGKGGTGFLLRFAAALR
jgi:hypothetical protein